VIFSDDDFAKLQWLHVQRTWLAHCFFPQGERRLHTGMGPLDMGGYTWEGISDPFGGQLVGMSGIEEPIFGQAVAVEIVLSGANREFLKTVWTDRHAIIGRRCDLYFATVEPETGETLVDIKRMIRGKFSAPAFSIIGASVRAIKIKVVAPWEGLNFPETGYMWSPAGARQRNSGDKGQDHVNDQIIDDFKP